jgi:FtsP/CotA-like multicopper oxidase with cupredoxin domain
VNGGPSNSYTACLGRTELWRVGSSRKMGATAHPFHMHVNHFQVVDVECLADDGGPVPCDGNTDYAVGDVRDSIIIPSPGFATIKFVPADFHGEGALAHCHIFGHEELGMRLNLDINETCSNS